MNGSRLLLDGLLTDLDRIRRHAERTCNRYVIAKAIAASHPDVLAALRQRLVAGRAYTGTSCLPQTRRDEIDVLFHLSCLPAIECRFLPFLLVTVSLSQRTVLRLDELPPSDTRDPSLEHPNSTFSPSGELPFSLAVSSQAQHVVSAPEDNQPLRAAEDAFYRERGITDTPAPRPATEHASETAARNTVVVLASVGDVPARLVAREIKNLGGRAVILDPSSYPEDIQLSCTIASPSANAMFTYSLRCRDIVVRDSDLTGVWRRYPQEHGVAAAIISSHVRRFCQRESQVAFEAWLHLLGNRVINPIAAEHYASLKPVQLLQALRIGLSTPYTLATNDSDAVLQLASARDSFIFKTFAGAPWGALLETRPWRQDDVEQLSQLKHAPAIFQERIHKIADVRATVVDGDVFAVRIDSRRPEAALDHRLDPTAPIQAHRLPSKIAERVMALVQALGLRYAGVDLGLCESGEYVFFEVNCRGQFVFMEVHGQQPIAQSLARALLRVPPAWNTGHDTAVITTPSLEEGRQ